MISSVSAVTVEYSNYTEDYVDNNTSDVGALSDLGTHSTFDNEKASDGTFDTLTEENDGVAGFNLEDFVDTISNLRSPTDIGTHSSFAEEQDKDGSFDLLTEGDTGGAGGTTEYSPTTSTDPLSVITDDALSYDGSLSTYAYHGVGADAYPAYTITTFGTGTGTITNVDLVVRHYSTGIVNDQYGLKWVLGASADQVLWAMSTTTRALDNYTFTSLTEPNDGTWIWSDISSFTLIVDTEKVTGPDAWSIYWYEVVLKVTISGASNYDLDLEVGWTVDTDYDETNEYLCIFGGTQGAESLRVDIWDDVTTNDWVNVITDLTAGWNNISLNSGTDYLDDTDFEIRFTDTSDESTLADTWQVEAVLLHTWTDAVDNYELDLEVQFTTITATQYGSTEEWLCIKTGTQGAEALMVDIWYSSAWQSLSTDLDASTWNNISISSYLDSATLTIRFKGATETGDTTTQDTWQIDAVLIQTYSYACSHSVFEVLDFSSSTNEAAGVSITNSEVIDFSDSESDSLAAGVVVNEVIALQESLDTAVQLVVQVFEVIDFQGSVSTAMSVVVSLFETIGIAVSLTVTRKMSITINEIVGLAEVITVAANYVVTSYQEIGFTATVTTAVTYLYQSSQLIGLTETVTAGASYTNTFNVVIELLSSVSTSVGTSGTDYSVTISVVFTFGDSITNVVDYVVTSSQVIELNDSLSTVANFIVTNSEVIGIAGVVTAGAGRIVRVNEVIDLFSSVDVGAGYGIITYQVIDLSSSISHTTKFIVTNYEVIAFAGSTSTSVSYKETISEVIKIISSVSTRIPGAPQQYIVNIYEIIDFGSGTSYEVTGGGGPITGTEYQVIINEIIPIGDRKHRRPSTIDLTTLVTIGAAASVMIIIVEYKTEVFRETYTVAKEWIIDSTEILTDPKPKIPKPKTKHDEKIKIDKKTKKPKIKPEPRTPKPKKIPKKKTPRTPKIDIKTIQKQSKPMQSKIVKTGKVKKSMIKTSKARQQKTIKIGKDMEKKIRKQGKRPR